MIDRFLFNIADKVPFQSLLNLSGMRLFLPFYHLVSDEPAPHIEQLYPVRNSARFKADLDWILRYFQPVSLDEVIAGKQWNKPVFHLSFDDGLRQCYDTIAPVLLEKGIPATFFINPDFIDNNDLMYRYKASLLAGRFPELRQDFLPITYQQKDQLDQEADSRGVDFRHFLDDYQPYMTFDQISYLIKKGFGVGGHSMDHPLYSSLPLSGQLLQTSHSLAFISQKWGIPHPTFAFPFTDAGVNDAFFENLPPNTFTFGCAGVKKEHINTHFQRFAMEKYQFSAPVMIGAAYLSYLAKKMAGREYARR